MALICQTRSRPRLSFLLSAMLCALLATVTASSAAPAPSRIEIGEYERETSALKVALIQAASESERAEAHLRGWGGLEASQQNHLKRANADLLAATEQEQKLSLPSGRSAMVTDQLASARIRATKAREEISNLQAGLSRVAEITSTVQKWSAAASSYQILIRDHLALAQAYATMGETLRLSPNGIALQKYARARDDFRSGRARYDDEQPRKKTDLDAARKAYEGLKEISIFVSSRKKAETASATIESRLEKARSADPKSPALIVSLEEAATAHLNWIKVTNDVLATPWDASSHSSIEAAEKLAIDSANAANLAERNAGKFKEPGVQTRHFLLSTGVTSLSPYKIKSATSATNFDGTPITLPGNQKFYYLDDSTQVDVLGFIDFRFRRNLAWDRAAAPKSQRAERDNWSLSCDAAAPGSIRRPNWIHAPGSAGGQSSNAKYVSFFTHKCWMPSNIDFRSGYVFGKDGTVNGSTLAGSGDAYVGLTFGWPLLNRDWSTAKVTDVFSLEVAADVVTERAVQDAHDRYSLGLAYAIGYLAPPFAFPGNNTDSSFERVWEFTMRGGYASIETPNAFPNSQDICVPDCTAGSRVVRVRNHSKPKFKAIDTFTVEIGAQMPVGQAAYLTLSSGIYGGDPNPWFMRLGITVPIDGLLGVFSEYTL